MKERREEKLIGSNRVRNAKRVVKRTLNMLQDKTLYDEKNETTGGRIIFHRGHRSLNLLPIPIAVAATNK